MYLNEYQQLLAIKQRTQQAEQQALIERQKRTLPAPIGYKERLHQMATRLSRLVERPQHRINYDDSTILPIAR